mgnify:CR=1 FL=1
MIAPKKNKLNEKNPTLLKEESAIRPNIEHLIKRISQERLQEKKTRLIMMVLIFSGLTAVSIFFSQS